MTFYARSLMQIGASVVGVAIGTALRCAGGMAGRVRGRL